MRNTSLLLTAFLALAGFSAAADRPNIVFLLTDDQACISLGCYGSRESKTPNIDALAAEGIVFDRHYDTTAICMASRASIMTGKLEYKTGCNFDTGPLLRKDWEQSYPVLLRQAGYRTAFAGKFGFEVLDPGRKKPTLPESDFDRWGGGPGQTFYETARNKSMADYAEKHPHSTRSYGAFGSDFIRDAAKSGQPFCLSISFKAPHHPVTPDPIDDREYAGATFARPGNFGRENGLHFSKQSRQGRQYERFVSWDYDKDYDGIMAKYNQQVFAIDAAVGMIRTALAETGAAKNTVVIFTSDNGFLCGAHGYGSKVLPYEESSRVPLIVFDPRQELSLRGRRCGALTGNIDFHPTLLELAGLPISDSVDGRSLLPLCDDPLAETHSYLPLINVWGPRACHSLAVVTRDWKYVYWNYAADGFAPTEELYHLREDPLELKNCAGSAAHSDSLSNMRQFFDKAVKTWTTSATDRGGYRSLGLRFVRK